MHHHGPGGSRGEAWRRLLRRQAAAARRLRTALQAQLRGGGAALRRFGGELRADLRSRAADAHAGLRRAGDALGRFSAELRADLRSREQDVRGWLARAGAFTRRQVELRWPGVRLRIIAANDAIERGAHRLWAGILPRGRRAAAFARRHAPPPRALAGVGILAVLLGWALWERCGVQGCPDLARVASFQPGGASVLLDRDGERFADLAPMEYEVVALDSLPSYVAQAFVAVEDRRFFQHRGVDWIRVVGALVADIRAGAAVQGSSTIPMQLARTLFPERMPREQKSIRRKLLEARVAAELEDTFSKEEILELYLNHIYLGGGTQGVQSASRYYFGKDAAELAVEEAALLAALPRAPAHYDPRVRPEAAKERRDLVLTLMERQALLPPQEAQEARERPVVAAAEPLRAGAGERLAPWFVQHVRRLLEEELGETLYRRPLRIHTTLDTRTQQAAEEALEDRLRALERGSHGRASAPRYGPETPPAGGATPYLQGAVVVMDARTGAVRAWVGGRDFRHSRYDRARLARRQAGSAFKPFVYAAALAEGFAPSQVILDAPYRLAGGGGRSWSPRNYSGGFEGPMSMREALVRSQNVPAVRLAAAVGSSDVAALVEQAGIAGEVPPSPVAALGVTAVSPVEMATAFSGFAAEGIRVEPRFVLGVTDADGAVVWESETAERARMVSGDVAYVVTDMLQDVVNRGTATGVRAAGYRGPAAGKTGTTSDATDVWFVGYTPELVASIWVGYDDVRPLPARATGGGVAAPVFGSIMARTYRGRTPPPWPARPPGVSALLVDPESGLALQSGCHPRYAAPVRELFIRGSEPPATCPRTPRRGFMSRLEGLLESVFGGGDRRGRGRGRDAGDGHRGGAVEADPDLGAPRLPRRESAGERGQGAAPR